MKRREFLQASGAFAVVGSSLFSIHKAEAETGLPVASLKAGLDPQRDLVLVAGDASPSRFDYNTSFNKRRQITPQVRVVASSPQAVGHTVRWAAGNGVGFAIRSGGHSYEGFSQSADLVIDVRGMASIKLAADKKSVAIGSGASLGAVYAALEPSARAIPAGTCFPVGVAGHALGGGFGLLARPFGLACDSVLAMEVVDASGNVRNVSAQQDPDLFWALRGGGNGSFGVVTKFNFRTSAVNRVAKFATTWNRPAAQAAKIVLAWQDWLEALPPAITCTLHLTKAAAGSIKVHIAGLSVDTESKVITELKRLQKSAGAAEMSSTSTLTFARAATIFNGGGPAYESVLMKGKSDYIVEPLTGQGISVLLDGLQKAPGEIAVLFDSYGGAINQIASDATAFIHRGKTKYLVQYFLQWGSPGATETNLAMIRTLYASMRPYVSGRCYVNYCDLDLGEGYAKAYWGDNLPRLMTIKAAFDPNNVFRHAQSVPRAIV
ncbi:MAG TPA: FAD-binding oxidoreductase [Bradyrhizobium sp.]|uniref:FAD-binding oxidoreductase n=1 Tax=Bradyrhizobium sp. TaxID=376 RepID=UPI002D7EB0A5|nr:FAD-binding oxidoreductase [Bradyrhizobium sp.]HET7885035.1 FAD-binding oxidoreductase [Bradyrhizobium sp.]